jgi:hypothetical protein
MSKCCVSLLTEGTCHCGVLVWPRIRFCNVVHSVQGLLIFSNTLLGVEFLQNYVYSVLIFGIALWRYINALSPSHLSFLLHDTVIYSYHRPESVGPLPRIHINKRSNYECLLKISSSVWATVPLNRRRNTGKSRPV